MEIKEVIRELLNMKKFNYTLAPVEVFDMAISALKKQDKMKVSEIHVDEYYCPACGAENNCDQRIIYDKYCPNCGQKLDKTKI